MKNNTLGIVSRNSYRHGLKVGDIVSCKMSWIGNVGNPINYTRNYKNILILEREFLFENETAYGIRSFWKYKGIDIDTNKINRFRTQDLKVNRIISSLEGLSHEV